MEPNTQPTPETGIVPVEKVISNGLAVFESKKQELTDLANTSKLLKVTDITDKKQLEAVAVARKALKKERVAIENQGAELRKNLTDISKSVSAKEKELVGLIEPTETALLAEEKRVENELEFIRKESERKEKELIQSRVKELIDNGCAFDGVNYTIAGLSVNDTMLKVMNEGQFSAFAEKAKSENDIIKAAAEEEKRKLAEQELIAEQAKKDEAERIRLAGLELAKQQAAFQAKQEQARKEAEERQAAINAENLRIASEQRAKAEELLRQAEEIQKEKDAAALVERQRLQTIENERIAAENEKLRIERERLAQIEAENARIQKEKEEAEALRIEQETQAALAPDKEKLQAFSDALGAITCQPLADANADKIYQDAVILVTKIQAHIAKGIKSLTKAELFKA